MLVKLLLSCSNSAMVLIINKDLSSAIDLSMSFRVTLSEANLIIYHLFLEP